MKKLCQPLITLLLIACIGCNPESKLLLEELTFPEDSEATEFDVILETVSIDPEAICGDIVEKPLITGGGKSVLGTFLIANDQDKIYLEFIMKECWEIVETHIYIGDFDDMPVLTSGKPDYYEFTYTNIYDPLPLEVSIPIGIQDLPKDENGILEIVAHAKIINNSGEVPVVKSVLAEWDDDLLFLGPRRGGGFYYEIQSCPNDLAASALNGDLVPGLDDEMLVFDYCGVDKPEWDLWNKKNDPTQVEKLGTVLLSTDEENMIFEFTVVENWKVESVHVNVGAFDTDQNNPVGTVPRGKYDFGASYDPPEATTVEDPLPFTVALVEMVGELDGNCEIFYIIANLTRDIIVDDVVIGTESQAVSVAWSNDLSASSRQRGGSIGAGSQGGSTQGGGQGSGSPSQGSVEPASVYLCLLPCEVVE